MDRNEEERIKVIKIPIVLKKSIISKEKPSEDGFVLDWERALGYKANPYKNEILEPVSSYTADFDIEKEKLNLFIYRNNPNIFLNKLMIRSIFQ